MIRFSLVNKALIALAVILLCTQAAQYVINRQNVETLFVSNREAVLNTQRLLLQASEREISDHFHRIGRSLLNDNENRLPSKLEPFWYELSRHARFPLRGFSIEQANGQWQHFGLSLLKQKNVKEQLRHARAASWYMDCSNQCHAVFSSQFLDADKASVRLFYSFSFNEWWASLSHSSSSRYAILRNFAQSNGLQVLELDGHLHDGFSETISEFDIRDLEKGLYIEDGEYGYLELLAIPLSEILGDSLHLLIINNLDELKVQKAELVYRSLAFAALSIICSLLLLVVVLYPPLRNVRRSINSLPLLARSSFHLFRSNLSTARINPFHDESTQLNQALLQLSYQLETLEQQLKQRAEELDWAANMDVLTQMPNRRSFEKRFSESLMQGHQGCLLMVDLDNFKLVNDISGHSAGDAMLKAVAQTLQRLLPAHAMYARTSGDEFTIFLKDCKSSEAWVLGQRICHLIEQLSVAGYKTIHRASASVGLIETPAQGKNYEELMSKVSLCVHQAKDAGKNSVIQFNPDESNQHLVQQHYWLALARQAIETKALTLYYQPIMCNRTDALTHYEVLLRVRDEHGELHSPYQLILAAEKSGLIEDIDVWVIQQALLQLQRNLTTGHGAKLSINLSARSFCSEKVISRIAHEFEQLNIDGELIIFEITETAALTNMDVAIEHIGKLKALGCAIALDDFGVGYSSFHSLQQLPLDYIKIDGSFVSKLLDEPNNQVFVRAIVAIAQELGYKTIAEFVESKVLYQKLKELGVDYAQGYYIGRPAVAAAYWQHARASSVLSN